MVGKVISGGQSGVDLAALDAAMDLGIPTGGWCPRGRPNEDGTIPLRYPVSETPETHYGQRTQWNVRDADHTLILSWGPPTGGTLLTVNTCRRTKRFYTLIQLSDPDLDKWAVKLVRQVLAGFPEGSVLNVAGPRESKHPGIHEAAKAFLLEVLKP